MHSIKVGFLWCGFLFSFNAAYAGDSDCTMACRILNSFCTESPWMSPTFKLDTKTLEEFCTNNVNTFSVNVHVMCGGLAPFSQNEVQKVQKNVDTHLHEIAQIQQEYCKTVETACKERCESVLPPVSGSKEQ